MDKERKRQIKMLGKQLVEQRSQEVQRLLHEANPAPVGSDEWARNYRNQVAAERRLRQGPPDHLTAPDARASYVLHPYEMGHSIIPVPTIYVECPRCGDVIHTDAAISATCACGGLRVDVVARKILFATEQQPRCVSLIGRGDAPAPPATVRPWWKFW